MTGQFVLNGTPLKSVSQKDVFRDVAWAYRFWRAGHHPSMRLAELRHAASRIGRFATAKTAGRTLRDWLSSELGIALMLDEHVNRPGHVPGTLEKAIAALGGAVPKDPAAWTKDHEHRLIDAYLDKRNDTNMTDSDKRAAKIADFARQKRLSEERNSFMSA
jgi:hypothetical protein